MRTGPASAASLWCGGQRVDGMSVGKLVATPSSGRVSMPGWPNTPHRACATPPMTIPLCWASPATRSQRGICAAMPSASMTRSKPWCVPRWGIRNWVSTTGYRSPSSSSATLQDIQAQSAGQGHRRRRRDPDLGRDPVGRPTSNHYLAVFDGVNGQVIVAGHDPNASPPPISASCCCAKDRGCTRPGCDAPGYNSQVHHATKDWKNGGNTDIDDLALACKRDNLLVETGGWDTRQTAQRPNPMDPTTRRPMLEAAPTTTTTPNAYSAIRTTPEAIGPGSRGRACAGTARTRRPARRRRPSTTPRSCRRRRRRAARGRPRTRRSPRPRWSSR